MEKEKKGYRKVLYLLYRLDESTEGNQATENLVTRMDVYESHYALASITGTEGFGNRCIMTASGLSNRVEEWIWNRIMGRKEKHHQPGGPGRGTVGVYFCAFALFLLMISQVMWVQRMEGRHRAITDYGLWDFFKVRRGGISICHG